MTDPCSCSSLLTSTVSSTGCSLFTSTLWFMLYIVLASLYSSCVFHIVFLAGFIWIENQCRPENRPQLKPCKRGAVFVCPGPCVCCFRRSWDNEMLSSKSSLITVNLKGTLCKYHLCITASVVSWDWLQPHLQPYLNLWSPACRPAAKTVVEAEACAAMKGMNCRTSRAYDLISYKNICAAGKATCCWFNVRSSVSNNLCSISHTGCADSWA